jgi:predicted phosphodiesterase
VTFYGELLEAVPQQGFRAPDEDETVALLVSDRHDNIGMDPVSRAIGDAGGATVLITAGDDTSTGGSWEVFSISSLADAFEGYDVVAAAGNHDTGTAVVDAYRDAGFTVLEGEPTEVAGIRFLGDHDPRSSGLTAGYTEGEESVAEQGSRLASVACEDGEVSTLVVHSPSTGEAVAESGCVDLVVSGHLHRQVGPDTVMGDNGEPTAVYTNGTTGGAAYAFALGSKLRRDAQVTLLTYRDGRPVGLQPVTITPGGEVVPADYVELPAPENLSGARR